MKTIIVKSHKRKGRMVKSHARKSHARLFPDGPAYVDSQTMDNQDTSMSDGYYDENGDWVENSHARIKKINKAKSKAHEMATLKQPTSGKKVNQERVLSINRKMNRGNSLSNDSTLFSKSKQGKKGVYNAKMKTYKFHKK